MISAEGFIKDRSQESPKSNQRELFFINNSRKDFLKYLKKYISIENLTKANSGGFFKDPLTLLRS